MPPPSTVSWQNPRVLSVLLVVFLCGGAVGALAMRSHLHRSMHRTTVATPDNFREITLDRLQRELSLNETQVEQVRMLLDDFFMYVHQLQTQMDEVRANGKSKIMLVLDDNQKKKFEKLVSDMQPKSSK